MKVNLKQTYFQGLELFAKSVKKQNPMNNERNNATITYKTQNSRYESQENQNHIRYSPSNESLSQSRATKLYNQLQNKNKISKNTAATLKQSKKKIKTYESQIASNHFKSRYQTKQPQIHSVPNSKQISLYSNRLNSVQKIKTQVSKALQKQSRHTYFSVEHKAAKDFDQIFSSTHENYIGVKREYKNSNLSLKKQKSDFIKIQNQEKSGLLGPIKADFLEVDKKIVNSGLSEQIRNSNQYSRSFKTEKSQKKDKNIENNSKMHTKISEKRVNDASNLKFLNPQNDEGYDNQLQGNGRKSMRMRSKQSEGFSTGSKIIFEQDQMKTESENLELSKILSPVFELGESRRQFFSQTNQELNENVKNICSSFDTQILNCRVTYQNRLRQLKEPSKTINSTDLRKTTMQIL